MGLLRLQHGGWKKVSGETVNDVCEHRGEVVVAQQNRLWRVVGDALEPLVKAESPFPVSRLISHCETLYVQGAGRLTFVEGQRLGGQDVYDSYADQAWDWGSLPSPDAGLFEYREAIS